MEIKRAVKTKSQTVSKSNMATQTLHITKYESDNPKHPDGMVSDREKNPIGGAWNMAGPSPWIKIQLKNSWVVTDEDYKLLQKVKQQKNGDYISQ